MCCTAPRAFVWLTVLNCREITSNLCANQRISNRPDPRLLHSCGPFTNSFDFFLSFLLPFVHPPRPSLTLFPIFSYRKPVVVYFFFLWETVHSSAVHLLYLFHCFVIFFFFNISVHTDFTPISLNIQLKLFRYAWYIYCIYYTCAHSFSPSFIFRSTNYNWLHIVID